MPSTIPPAGLNAPSSRQRINLLVKSTLIAEARRYNVNISNVLNDALDEHVRRVRREQWLASTYPAVATYNRRVETEGLLSTVLWDE